MNHDTDIFHVDATRVNMPYRGDDLVCTEVLCRAHPDNEGRVWVRIGEPATDRNAMPLDKRDGIIFSITNLNELYILIEKPKDIVIIGYSR